MRIRRFDVAAGAVLAFVAATADAGCGGQTIDDVSQDAGVDDAQTADGSLDSGTTDAATDDGGDAAVSACPPHQVICTGVCTDTRFDPSACGSCTNRCGPGEVCSNGACAGTCPSTQAACRDEDGGLHCADALSDNANCGYCGNVCAPGTVCSAGKCSVTCSGAETRCVAGDGTAFCTDLQTDPDNCNACGTGCPRSNTGTAFCSAGQCGVTCKVGLLDCNGNPTDGCEVNPSSDRTSCGGCGTICPVGAACYDGTCGCTSSLFGTLELCGSACTDIERDPTNCGGCGTRCTPSGANQSAACVESACRYSNRGVITPYFVTSIALDGTYVYFVQRGTGVERVSKESVGEIPVSIIADPMASYMAIHAGMIFWTSSSGIFECPVTGCVGAPKMLYDGNATGSRIFVDDSNFYWMLGSGLNKCPQIGCNGAPITMTNQEMDTMALGPSSVFAIPHYSPDPDNLYSISTSDPPTSTVLYATHSYPNGVAYHGGRVYFFTLGNLVGCDPTNCVPAILAPQPINYNSSGVYTYYGGPIVADDTSVLWVADGIHELNLSTGVDSVIANIKSIPTQLVLDATNVYWAGYDGVYWAAR